MNLNRLKGEIVAVFGTQDSFSKAIGWHRNKVSRLITGKYIPDIDEAAKISSLLNLSSDKYCEIFLSKKSPNGEHLQTNKIA